MCHANTTVLDNEVALFVHMCMCVVDDDLQAQRA
jgi:hypothetical protein